MSISLTPLEDKIIVKQAEAETQTASGLFIPDNAKEKPQQGEALCFQDFTEFIFLFGPYTSLYNPM